MPPPTKMTPAPAEEEARVALPTSEGAFELRLYQVKDRRYAVLIKGDVVGAGAVPTRVHSECFTGDTLGSLRCECGLQLRYAMRKIRSEARGVLIYVAGHEGRGVGLANKLRAYIEQDLGADTVDANLHLGLPADARDYSACAAILKFLGVSSIVLLTNNPNKVTELESLGIAVEATVSIPLAPHARSMGYVSTKQTRLGHSSPIDGLKTIDEAPPDVGRILGIMSSRTDRPYVVVKYAQSIDGRIATSTGDSKWISSEPERVLSHALRARCDAIMVGAGTVFNDDPQLTVRMVTGASPLRILADSQLGADLDSRIFDGAAPTRVFTTVSAEPHKVRALKERAIGVDQIDSGPGGVDLRAVFRLLADDGVGSVIVEGGSRLITSLFKAKLVDRLVVTHSPMLIGSGTEAIRDLGTEKVGQALRLDRRELCIVGDDVVTAWDVRSSNII